MSKSHIYVLTCCLLFNCVSNVVLAAVPVQINYIGNRPAKPPMENYVVRLIMENDSDTGE